MDNPYLQEWQRQACDQEQRLKEERQILRGSPIDWDSLSRLMAFKERHGYVQKYAWAIPTEDAVRVICRYSPLIEIGGGTGYWAWLLRQASADIQCFDIAPPSICDRRNPYHPNTRTWVDVLEGNEMALDNNPGRTLFLCWPPPRDPMAHSVLSRHVGEFFVYAGELGAPRGLFEGLPVRGSSADQQFESLLNSRWIKIGQLELPNWDGCWSTLSVFRRRAE